MVLGEKINKINIRDIFSTKTKYVFFSYKKIRKEMEMEVEHKEQNEESIIQIILKGFKVLFE